MAGNLWITYAWTDNQDKDIDYIAKELDTAGLNCTFDNRALIPGQTLWDQIGKIISDPARVDAFSIVVTPSSLASNSCREELLYALDRALSQRGSGFPLIGLLHNVRVNDLPPALKIRLCVPLSAPNWIDQVVAGVNKRPLPQSTETLSPFIIKKHSLPFGCCIQITPRVDHVSPIQLAINLEEKNACHVERVFVAPSSTLPGQNGTLSFGGRNVRAGDGEMNGRKIFYWQMDDEATPIQSCWIIGRSFPSKVWFGTPTRGLVEITV